MLGSARSWDMCGTLNKFLDACVQCTHCTVICWINNCWTVLRVFRCCLCMLIYCVGKRRIGPNLIATNPWKVWPRLKSNVNMKSSSQTRMWRRLRSIDRLMLYVLKMTMCIYRRWKNLTTVLLFEKVNAVVPNINIGAWILCSSPTQNLIYRNRTYRRHFNFPCCHSLLKFFFLPKRHSA